MTDYRSRFRVLAIPLLALAAGAACTPSILLSPKTIVDRVIEARSLDDIADDNRIVIAVNGIMADLGTIKASTEIYEQRLLITGLFDDKALYDGFKARVDALPGIKELYWHVAFLSREDQARRRGELLDWADALVLDVKVGIELIGTRGVADVNFRVAADAMSTIYLIGRARSREEFDKALAIARAVEGVKKVVNYVVVRP